MGSLLSWSMMSRAAAEQSATPLLQDHPPERPSAADPSAPSLADILWARVCSCPRDPGQMLRTHARAHGHMQHRGVRLLERILGPPGMDAAQIEARAHSSLRLMSPGWVRQQPADWTRALAAVRARNVNGARDLGLTAADREALGLSLATHLHDLGLCDNMD